MQAKSQKQKKIKWGGGGKDNSGEEDIRGLRQKETQSLDYTDLIFGGGGRLKKSGGGEEDFEGEVTIVGIPNFNPC